MDDAFVGGVCRCMYCGTIQTVPSHLKKQNGDRPAAAAQPQASKALFMQTVREQSESGTGLDDLAEAVSGSSGLTGSGLRSGRLRAQTIAPQADPRRKMFLLAGCGAGTIVLLGIVLWISFSSDSSATGAPGTPPGSAATGSRAAPGESNFCGVPINERVVVYVLDRGSATAELFGDLKEACYRSIQSLGPDRKFQIIFWNNGSEAAFPRAGPTFATDTNLEAARRTLEDVNAHGQSEAVAALAKAFAASPDAIVLATVKGFELDDAFVQMVGRIGKGSKARIYTFALGAGESGTALKTIAKRTGGKFRAIPAGALREHAHSP